MDYDEKRIFIRSRAAFVISCAVYTLLFIDGLFMQRFLFVDYAQVIISVFLVISSFFINLLFGIPGYWISTALTLVQIYIYTALFSYRFNYNVLVLIGLALLSILINTIFEFFIIRVSERIESLGKKLSAEKRSVSAMRQPP